MKKFLKDLWAAMVAEDQQPPMNPWMLALGQAVNILLIIALSFIACLLMGSCKTQTIIEKEYITQHDTLTQVVNNRDSIYIHDSIYHEVMQKGDTVFVLKDRWHTAYVDRLKHDSIYIHKTDTCYVENEKVIEKKPSWWQRFSAGFGNTMMVILLMLGAIIAFDKLRQR